MLKAEITDNGKSCLEIGGNIVDITSDTASIVQSVHSALLQRNEEAAKFFRGALLAELADPKSCVWEQVRVGTGRGRPH